MMLLHAAAAAAADVENVGGGDGCPGNSGQCW